MFVPVVESGKITWSVFKLLPSVIMQDEYTTVFTTYCLIWTKLWFETTSIDAVVVIVVDVVVVHAVVVHAVVVDAVVVAQQ